MIHAASPGAFVLASLQRPREAQLVTIGVIDDALDHGLSSTVSCPRRRRRDPKAYRHGTQVSSAIALSAALAVALLFIRQKPVYN
jgi:hypothetical protein